MSNKNKNLQQPDNSALHKTDVRCRFFAQYWGSKTLYVGGAGLQTIGKGGWNLNHPDFFLQLKTIEDISDDDAVEFFDIVWGNVGTHKDKSRDFKIKFGKDWALSPFSERYGLIPTGLFHGIDYLRSKGYALPFMGHSIQDMVSLGWLQLV